MNYIDLLLIIPLAYSIYKGFSKGLVIMAASLAALLLGIWGAIKFAGFTSGLLTEKFQWNSEYLPIISFAITFVAIVIAVHLVGKLLNKMVEILELGFVNRLLGILFSLLKTGFILSIILILLIQLDKKTAFLPEGQTEDSLLFKPISRFAPMIFPYLRFEKRHLPDDRKDTENQIMTYHDNQTL